MVGHRSKAYRDDTIRKYRQLYGIVMVYREDIQMWQRVDTTRPWVSDQPPPLGRPCRRPEDAAWDGGQHAVAR